MPLAIFLEKMTIFGNFFEKMSIFIYNIYIVYIYYIVYIIYLKCQVFRNVLTFKWQFSGGADEDIVAAS